MKIKKVLAGLTAAVFFMAGPVGAAGIGQALAATAPAGGQITSYKCGTPENQPVTFLVLNENEAQLGDGRGPAVDEAVTGTVFIPKAVTDYGDFEEVKVYNVTGIGDYAFNGCSGLEKIQIEGEVALSAHAFDGLPETTSIETNSRETKRALLGCGIDPGHVRYTGVRTNYVAFGDSIAAGYALPGYEHGTPNDDRFPTPEGAFVNMLGETLESQDGPALVSNQAVSGWTSEQLLEALQSGQYSELLRHADVVTVTIGSNDLLGPFIKIVEQAINDNFSAKVSELENLSAEAAEAPGSDAQLREKQDSLVTEIANTLRQLNKTLKDNPELLAGCENFKDNLQPAVLSALHEQAPGAEIYWNTLYNPFYGETLNLSQLFPNLAEKFPLIFRQFESIDLSGYGAYYIEQMNQAFLQNTEGYHSVDIYEAFNEPDLTNVEIKNTEGKLSLNFDPHPNAAGHQLIAERYTSTIRDTYTSTDPEPDLSSQKAITGFRLGENAGSIDETAHRILVRVPWNTDLTRQTAVFEASAGAEVRVGGAVQTSGESVNDFTRPLSYVVIAEDLSRQTYEVTVEGENPAAAPDAEAGSFNRHVPDSTAASVATGLSGGQNGVAVLSVIFVVLAGGIVCVQYARGRGKK
ncbi:GDSL-type esterase/lipase family protein [Eubacterium sp. 1001713B170207_170306_E7]|uniref:GDSL-type esterase/lipase family protein n=1 Tax=Eubacterium sp. 1001713B170207_170306_E7 TaxID=2787097 RepID=UPI001898711F|nr:GDSL-type esterase/lipase family protein [Eubacterium sp. 1001713B170207_170306_E7]